MKHTTCFSALRLTIAGMPVWLEGNSKIGGRGSRVFDDPPINAWSLPAPECCPGSTASCRSWCYVHADRYPPELRQRHLDNWTAWQAWRDRGRLVESAAALGRWIGEHCAEHGWRWHVSGDIPLDPSYAPWLGSVALLSRGVSHWLYTRTFNAVPQLRGIPNLAVNVSADESNYAAAYRCAQANGVRLVWTGPPRVLPPGSVVLPTYHLRRSRGATVDWGTARVCPADDRGQSPKRRCGPCSLCLE